MAVSLCNSSLAREESSACRGKCSRAAQVAVSAFCPFEIVHATLLVQAAIYAPCKEHRRGDPWLMEGCM